MTLARSVPMLAVAASASSHSGSSMRTERCCTLPDVRTVFNLTPLRCTYR